MSGQPKSVDSEAMFQSKEANPTSNTQRLSGEIGILQSNVVSYLHDLGKFGE